MKINQNIANLISELEYLIGDSCYNPNSYDGYTGDEGREFRYPVYTSTKTEDGINEYKHRGKVSLTPQEIRTLKYKFGSNHLFIGDGLIDVLNYLEERYNIDFNKLESNITE